MTTSQELQDPHAELRALGWDGLLAEIVTVEGQKAEAEQVLKAERREREAEIDPRRQLLQQLTQRAATLRDLLKREAVAAMVRAANGGRTLGAVRLPYKPKVKVLDVSAAALLLDGVMVVGPSGEGQPIVEWVPRINEDAARILIEALEGIKPHKVLRPGENGKSGGAIDTGAIMGLSDAAREAFTSPMLLDRDARAADKTTVRGWVGAIVLTRKDDPESYVLQLDMKLLKEGEQGGATEDDSES